MIDDLEDLLSCTTEKLGSVVHVGAGVCREYKRYVDLGAERILLVEPNTDLHDQLRQKTQNHPSVALSSMAVAPETGSIDFRVTSNFRFSSIAKPSGLYEYFPNVTIASHHQIQAVSLEKLLSDFVFSKQRLNLLVFETPGVEPLLLSATKAQVLRQFSRILVKRSEETFYEPVEDGAPTDLLQAMQRVGFSRVTLAESAPPFVIDVYQLNHEIVRLSEQLADAEEQLARATENLRAARVLTKERAVEATTLQRVAHAHQGELEALKKTAQQRETDLHHSARRLEALDDRLNARDAALAKATYRIRQVELELQDSQSGRAQADAALEQQREQLAGLTSALETEQDKVRKQASQICALEAESGELAGRQSAQLAELRNRLRLQTEAMADAQKLERSLAESDKQSAEAVAQLEALKAEHAESEQKHRLLEEEVRKAEIQIDLLADVLLRDRSV